MQALSRHRLTGNAYRVLGLPAEASQAAIDQAARRMRIWPDPRRIPPTPWDLPCLGEIPRCKNDIEQALARLAEPASRTEERMLWFNTGLHLLDAGAEANLDQLAAELTAHGDPAEQHDAALAGLHAAIIMDPEATDETRWRNVVLPSAKYET